MTIKVVAQDQSVGKRITCRNCGAVNEYLPIDVRLLHHGYDYGGSVSTAEGFPCGQCGHEIITRST